MWDWMMIGPMLPMKRNSNLKIEYWSTSQSQVALHENETWQKSYTLVVGLEIRRFVYIGRLFVEKMKFCWLLALRHKNWTSQINNLVSVVDLAESWPTKPRRIRIYVKFILIIYTTRTKVEIELTLFKYHGTCLIIERVIWQIQRAPACCLNPVRQLSKLKLHSWNSRHRRRLSSNHILYFTVPLR